MKSADFFKYFDDLKSPLSIIREGAYDRLRNEAFSKDFDGQERKALLELLISSDYLRWGISEGAGPKSVGRSFSLLAINLFIVSDKSFSLTRSLSKEIYSCLSGYLDLEMDWRSSSPDLGQIHCAAHFSDLLTSLFWHESFDDNDVLFLAMKFLERATYSDEDSKRVEEAILYICE